MSILIKDPNQCPACAKKGTIRIDQRRCTSCDAKVYKREDNFHLLHQNCIFSFWVYFPIDASSPYRGWVHSEHLKADAKPNAEEYPLEAPGRDYGKKNVIKGGGSAAMKVM